VIPMEKIRIENLGGIKKGKVDISKPLTIFTGPNNSGKSYMAYLVYGYNLFNAGNLISDDLFSKYKQSMIDVFLEDDVFEGYFTDYDFTLNFNDFSENYSDIRSNVLKNLLEDYSSKIFATHINYQAFVEVRQNFTVSKDKETRTIVRPTVSYDFEITDNTLIHKSNTKLSESDKENLKERVISMLFNHGRRSLFFPAERSGIHLFYREIFKKKAEQRDEIAEVIQNGNDIENAIKTFQEKVNPHGSLEFKPEKSRKKLPLHLASSMVKSLGGLVIYLRHLARKHDHIIIDEPELNLHPSTQVRLARLLAKIANQGIKLLISTHSDYIINELSNLILLANDFEEKEALREKYDYKKGGLIKAEDIGVYAFQNGTIDEIPVNEKGIEVEEIMEVIADMGERSDYIYYSHLDSLHDGALSTNP